MDGRISIAPLFLSMSGDSATSSLLHVGSISINIINNNILHRPTAVFLPPPFLPFPLACLSSTSRLPTQRSVMCEQVENDRNPAALQKQQPTTAAEAPVVVSVSSTVDRKVTTAAALSSDSDNKNQQPENASDNQSPQTAVAAVAAAAAAAAAASVAAAAAAMVEPSSEGGQQRPRPENIPKFVRVGQKVCFSTVVAAVLIPSSEDISEASKRELW